MKIVFFGTSSFAIPCLDGILESDHRLLCVVTRPPRPAGRGRRITQPPVFEHLSGRGVQVHQPNKLTQDFIKMLAGMDADVMVTASYGAWLPEGLLSSSRLGVVNVHPSLLPLYRGAAPVTRAILDGRNETGVSFMLTDQGWDTGPLLASFPMSIDDEDTAGTLEERLSRLAAERIVTVLEEYDSGILQPVPQVGEPIYAEKIRTDETWLDWSRPAEELVRMIRAFQPAPGARTRYGGRMLKITAARTVSEDIPPGELRVSDGILLVGCGGEESVRILSLQPESKKEMPVTEFLKGARIRDGEAFEGR